jgi:hypothetical protein
MKYPFHNLLIIINNPSKINSFGLSSFHRKPIIKKEEENISTNTSYRSVLVDIWKSMPTQKILQTTTFNFKLTKEIGEKGYKWCDDIHMSFQNKDATGTLKEIVNMVKVNKLTIKLSIKLETGRIVHFKIE